MKRTNNIQSIKKSASLLFGLAMALLMFFQQPYVVDANDTVERTEQSDQEKPEAEYQIMAYDLLLPAMQFNLFHSFDLLNEISVPEKIDFSLMEYVEKAYHNYFHTLFQLIISPNAP
ncbi:hypothetical protein [Marivirga arenosa]|uniref:Uncharacterized protein n=1 Tax=Marivirga arenosa TaxID=3059076 RepID=A0AA49GGV5_9BACT|nr:MULTISPECIES: hypothetical protein [unclassified Marivirga]WKK78930.2 hypothetical protein QYS47_15445 [Marivirga sp. BKB1-2]WKK86040.1 hypothetical protein QYS48_03215 [Marivirga sp. ABR2-2]